MNRQVLFAASAGLAAFLLVVAGAVISALPGASTLSSGAVASDAPVQVLAQQPTDTPQPLYDGQAVQELIAQRDATYTEALQQASDRLAQANAQLDQAYKDRDQALQKLQELQSTQTQGDTQPASATQAAASTPIPAEPGYSISPQEAAAIAARVAPGSTLTAIPTPVNFQGTVAYEVMLDLGAVYVDANTGKVLYNGATPPPAPNTTSRNTGGEQEEHEGSGGDD